MTIRERLSEIIDSNLGKEAKIDEIIRAFGIEPEIILTQEWEEDEDDESGYSSWGWEHKNGDLYDDVMYELEQVIEVDKRGFVTKAKFKYVG